MVEKEFAFWVSMFTMFAGFGIGVAFTVLAGIYRGLKEFTQGVVRRVQEHDAAIAQTEAEIKQHNAELEARIKRGCRQTVGNI